MKSKGRGSTSPANPVKRMSSGIIKSGPPVDQASAPHKAHPAPRAPTGSPTPPAICRASPTPPWVGTAR
eukprot:3868880-Prymnesium_polylepis.1